MTWRRPFKTMFHQFQKLYILILNIVYKKQNKLFYIQLKYPKANNLIVQQLYNGQYVVSFKMTLNPYAVQIKSRPLTPNLKVHHRCNFRPTDLFTYNWCNTNFDISTSTFYPFIKSTAYMCIYTAYRPLSLLYIYG